MYVRWRSRKRQRSAYGRCAEQDVHWAAILVESKRVNGKPVQRHIASLAVFTERYLKVPAQQSYIWKHVEARLRRLGKRISPVDEKHIKAALIEKIGKPPTKRQRAAFERTRRKILGAEYCEADPEGSHI
jgi:hypothetical protein